MDINMELVQEVDYNTQVVAYLPIRIVGCHNMVEIKDIVFLGQKYEVLIEEGVVKSLSRFNEKFKMWISIGFVGGTVIVEHELLQMLKNEYLLQKTGSDNSLDF